MKFYRESFSEIFRPRVSNYTGEQFHILKLKETYKHFIF